MAGEEGRWLEGLDERTEQDRRDEAMTGDETRGEAEVAVRRAVLPGTPDGIKATLIDGSWLIELDDDWLARRDAERDRARDAEARRVVERAVSALIATGRHTTETAHAALAEIEEGSP